MKQLQAQVRWMAALTREAESLRDQELADDLNEVLVLLTRIAEHSERNRYRSPNLKLT